MRSAFDKLISWTGLALAAVLLVAGGLLTWANTFIGDQVKEQFGNQDITMPSGPAVESLPEADRKEMSKFAEDGKNKLDSGPEAKAYADHYIYAHMKASGVELLDRVEAAGITEIPGVDGGAASPMPQEMNYSNASKIAGAVAAAAEEATAAGDTAKAEELTALSEEINSTRMSTFLNGNTLRGLLLYGYAFATMGTIAGIAALASFVGAAVMLLLVALGFWHAKKARDEIKGQASGSVPQHV